MSKPGIIAIAGAALAAASALSVTACGSPPDYTSATTCVASIVTGPNTSYLDGNISPGFTTYVIVNDSASQSRADCDDDITFEGEAAPPAGDSAMILDALPTGLTLACTGTGPFAWYGTVDVKVYVTDPMDQEGISDACMPKAGDHTSVPLPWQDQS